MRHTSLIYLSMTLSIQTNKKAEECAVCCQKVTEGEGEALFCEGKCQKMVTSLLCWCFSCPVPRLVDCLCSVSLCYVLPAVSWGRTRRTETAEVKELRAALQRVEARGGDALPSPPTENNEPWHTATRRKKRNKKGNNAGKSEAGASAFGTNQHIRTSILYMRNPLMYSGQLASKPWSTPERKSSSLVLVAFGAQ